MKAKIIAHCLVENEGRFIWYAINSVLPYVDQMMVWDMGSTDDTWEIVNSIESDKIGRRQVPVATSPDDLTTVRQQMIEETGKDFTWLMILDGDEIWPESSIETVTNFARENPSYESIVVRTNNLVGDIYHRLPESAGRYNLSGHTGHLALRFMNLKQIGGLCVSRPHGTQGFFDGRGKLVQDRDAKKIKFCKKIYSLLLSKENEKMANNALRVLGFAYSDRGKENELIFVGLMGMIDPPREEVKLALKECEDAGIKVVMITGDHKLTALAIGRELGFKGNCLTGEELDKIEDGELGKYDIYARVNPEHKVKILDYYKRHENIVAMTGDGVNDAPALKKADIGISMGIIGTDVARESSEIVLTDDNFATIVNAIEEGRNIYNKMIKSAKYLLSCNAGEITAVFMAIMLKFPLPLLPLQILLMNLLTDDFPALGLGFESNEEGIMKRPPRNPKERPITRRMFSSIAIFGLILFYFVVMGISSKSWTATISQFKDLWYWMLLLSGGFGIQIGLYTHLKKVNIRYLTAFAAGIIIATAFFEMIPEIKEGASLAVIGLGFFVIYLLENNTNTCMQGRRVYLPVS